MSEVFTFELPFDYVMYFSKTELYIYGILLCIVFVLTIKSFFVRIQGGREGLVGQKVMALDDFSKVGDIYVGQVLCTGEIWTAKADFPIMKGECLAVSSSRDLVLTLSAR